MHVISINDNLHTLHRSQNGGIHEAYDDMVCETFAYFRRENNVHCHRQNNHHNYSTNRIAVISVLS